MSRLQLTLRILCFATVLAMLSACAAPKAPLIEATNPAGAKMLANSAPKPVVYRFNPGDELSVTAVGEPSLSVTEKIDPYGYMAYPYLGQVYVKGLSPQQVAARLTHELEARGYYKRMMLSVSFVSAGDQYVYVLGEVKRPGPISITGSIPLLSAIGRAGGYTYDAQMSSVLWIRGNQSPPGVVKLNLASLGDPRAASQSIPNLALAPGDVLYVPDTVIASVQRFFKRISDILTPIVQLEQGIVLYPDVKSALKGQSGKTITVIGSP